MYKDDLVAAQARVAELEQQLQEKQKKSATPKPPKEPKPRGYWWGEWGKDTYGDITLPTFGSIVLGLVLVFMTVGFFAKRNCAPRDLIRKQMCRLAKPTPKAIVMGFKRLRNNKRFLSCEYFVPAGEKPPCRKSAETLDPAHYIE